MLEPVRPPFSLNLVNQLGRAGRRVGWRPLPFARNRLKAAASKATGLCDFGEPEHQEALEVLCRSLEEDAGLSMIGRIGSHRLLQRILEARLRRVDARHRRPELFAAPLNRPLIVMGLPRSGTTLLHRLLSQAADARPLRTWELQRPIPGPGRDRRRELTANELNRIKAIAPALDAKHFAHADEPEECMWLLDSSLISATFWTLVPVYGYFDWYLQQAPAATQMAYRAYREHLQLFQAETPQRRFTLKAPVHTGNLDALLTLVPEALVVQTHRDPKPVVASVNSLIYTVHSATSEEVDVARMGRTNLGMLTELVRRNLQARERWADRIYDVDYQRLLDDPVAVVRDVHHHFDLAWDEPLEQRLRAHLASRPQHRFGKHTYSLEECHLTAEQVDGAFAEYRQRFLGGGLGAGAVPSA